MINATMAMGGEAAVTPTVEEPPNSPNEHGMLQAHSPTKVKSRLLGRLRPHNKESRLVNLRAAALNRRQRP